MTTLSYSTDIVERRNFGKATVRQTLEVCVDFNEETGGLDVTDVNLYQEGEFIAEISKLLDKAEGCPLATIVQAINWGDVYNDYRASVNEKEVEYA